MEPKTYWEQRCNVNEKVLDELMRVLMQHLPPYSAEVIAALGNKWNEVIDKLDEDFKEKPKK